MSFNLEQHSGLSLVTPTGATAGAAVTGLSGAAATFSSAAFAFTLDGVWYTNNAVASGSLTSGNDVNTGVPATLTAGKARVFVYLVNASGDERIAAGPIVDNFTGNPCPWPPIPAGFVPFAAVVIQGGSTVSGTWTFNSSNWNATGITVGTVRNLAGSLPGFVLACA